MKIGFAEPDRRHTKVFERYVLDLSKHMTMTDVARHLGIGWHKVKEIQKAYLRRHFLQPSLKGLKRMAVDEISVGHGHHYLTVILDLDTGASPWISISSNRQSLLNTIP